MKLELLPLQAIKLSQPNKCTDCNFHMAHVSHLLHLGFEKNHTLKQYEMSSTELAEIQYCIEIK